MGFIESGNAYTEAVIDFYNLLCMLLILISFLIVYWLSYILTNNTFRPFRPLYIYNLSYFGKLKSFFWSFWSVFLVNKSFSYGDIFDVKDYPVLEASWTVVPIGFVSTVTYPSIGLEYGISPDITPTVIVKIIAHQWYWTFDIRTAETPGLSTFYTITDNDFDYIEEMYPHINDSEYWMLGYTHSLIANAFNDKLVFSVIDEISELRSLFFDGDFESFTEFLDNSEYLVLSENYKLPWDRDFLHSALYDMFTKEPVMFLQYYNEDLKKYGIEVGGNSSDTFINIESLENIENLGFDSDLVSQIVNKVIDKQLIKLESYVKDYQWIHLMEHMFFSNGSGFLFDDKFLTYFFSLEGGYPLPKDFEYPDYIFSLQKNAFKTETDFVNSAIYKLDVFDEDDCIFDYNTYMEELSNLEYTVFQKTIDLSLVQSNPNFYRMLATDSRIVLPFNTPIKLIVTSADVLHSFALPSLGLKIDAVPGRLSEQIIVVDRPGFYWGQCSELCGPYHGFMPVVFEFATMEIFIDFMRS